MYHYGYCQPYMSNMQRYFSWPSYGITQRPYELDSNATISQSRFPVAIQAPNGKYLDVTLPSKVIIAQATTIGKNQTFDVTTVDNQATFLLRARANSNYLKVTSEKEPAEAGAGGVGPHEKFQLFLNTDNTWGIYMTAVKKYLSLNPSDNKLYANATGIGTTEKFTFVFL